MSAPLRFVAGLMLVWGAARTAMLLPGAEAVVAPAPAPVRALLGADDPAPQAPVPQPAAAIPPVRVARIVERQTASGERPVFLPDPVAASLPLQAVRDSDALPVGAQMLLAASLVTFKRPDLYRERATPLPVARDAAGGGRRWSGDAYLFARGDRGDALAPGGQLGGGQAFARLSRTLGAGIAATARASGALRGDGREVALGMAMRPDPALPLGITVERRAGLDRAGRDAWAAFAAGGADAVRLAPSVRLDAYAQGGVVGARRADMFADGSARIGRTLGPVSIGGGAWGAAQPGTARLDLGPQAAVRLRLGDVAATAALDWRWRVAGQARPGNGLALTLAAGF